MSLGAILADFSIGTIISFVPCMKSVGQVIRVKSSRKSVSLQVCTKSIVANGDW
ncbi:Uncharacterised protein [Legionella busanensis]|uniref:Uncharacterized protein n=1 Tax=Legionella busanensis TaxID=190655 RepID=A0A378JV68_9GAMM|nr:Uncharacterised protein [Legionella busanensis]